MFTVFVRNHETNNVHQARISTAAMRDPVLAKAEVLESLKWSGTEWWDAIDTNGGWITGSEV